MPGFADDFIRRVRDANDIAQVVESYNISMRRRGGNLVALCPFHEEKTPSFNVNPAEQFFKCFGCDAKGDVISFVQRMEHLDFGDAIESLAHRAGIEVEYARGRRDEPREHGPTSRKALHWVNRHALAYFEECLHHPTQGREALAYLQGRGFDLATIRTWRLGWAPAVWDGLLRYLLRIAGENKREKVEESGVAAGVLRRREDGGVYDAFRGRVMFPILDARNRPVGFGGRLLRETPGAGGKYINTSEGKIFQKRKLLYGLNFAAKQISLTHTAVIVEGYTDTIMCHQYGIRNVVATLGTSLTEDHLQLLRRHVQRDGRVIALFDADDAGARASDRAIRLAMAEDVRLAVVRELEVKDACDFLPRFGAAPFRRELEKAVPAFDYVLRAAQARAGSDVGRQAAAVDSVMEVVNLSPNAVGRALMRERVAAAFKVPEATLPHPRRNARTGYPEPRPGSSPVFKSTLFMQDRERARRKCELRLLRYMLESRDWCERVAASWPAQRFADAACGELAELILAAWNSGQRPEIKQLREHCTRERAAAVLVDLAVPDPGLALCEEELRGLMIRLEAEQIEERLRDIKAELRASGIGEQRQDALSVEKIGLERKLAALR